MIGCFTVSIFLAGWAFGFSSDPGSWRLNINGQLSPIPVHVIKNMYFVSLADLAKLPGWKVTVDLGGRNISVKIPGSVSMKQMNGLSSGSPSEKKILSSPENKSSPQEQSKGLMPGEKTSTGVEISNEGSGPPNNVRMTVHAALSTLDELREALRENAASEVLKQKRDRAVGIVQQANNLLWSLPRTRTLQADIQVALEGLQSQVNLALAMDQVKDGLLPWTHPVPQNLLLKYPDLHPCHKIKEKVDGLDVTCARKMMTDLSKEDFNDVERDLDQYK